MSPEAAAVFEKNIRERLKAVVNSWIPEKFGYDEADDYISQQLIVLFECGGKGKSLPEFIHDSKSLFIWLAMESHSRICKKLDRGRKGRVSSGPSAQPEMKNSPNSETPPSFTIETSYLIDLLFSQEDAVALGEALRLALQDLKLWKSQKHVEVFEQVVKEESTKADAADSVGKSPTAISNYLEFASFCIAVRFGWSEEQLERQFPGNSQRWLRQLEEVLRGRR